MRAFRWESVICHPECIEFAANKYSIFPTVIFDALAYTFEPSAAVEQQRRQWIQSTFVSGFKLAFRTLPAELALMVARYCACEYAIAAVWPSEEGPNTYSMELVNGIWARYVKIESVWYLASLSDKPSPNAQLLLSIKAAANAHRMWVVEDHIGIRQVYFGNKTPPDRGVPGLWWRTCMLQSSTRLLAYYDVGFTAP